jgi:hypothetical protein
MFDSALPELSRALLDGFDHQLRTFKFYLAGASGLALQLGHRTSPGLEFFTSQIFQPEILSRYLKTLKSYKETLKSPGILTCTLRRVKLSFQYNLVHLRHPLLEYKTVMVADWRDILADIFKNLSERPSRKDFYDLYACLTLRNLDIPAAVATLRRRFAGRDFSYQQLLQNLENFKDADAEPELQVLKPLPWETVKDFFNKNLSKFERYLIAED